MKINSINSLYKIRKNPAFKSQYVNGHYYSDKVYSDAYIRKHKNYVEVREFISRYSGWEYWFTMKCERYTEEVNKCIQDILVDEKKKAERDRKLKAEQEALEAKKRALEEELEKNNKELEKKSIQNNTSEEFKNCDLSEEQKAEITEKVFSPIKIVDNNNDFCENIPNGVLLAGGNKEKSENINIILAKEILGKDFPNNYIKISNINNDDKFEEYMVSIKHEANKIFKASKKRTVLFMQDFDNFAADINSENYNPNINNFLKNYFLDCADNGCLIIASTKNLDNVEAPFIINKKRFGLVIEL